MFWLRTTHSELLLSVCQAPAELPKKKKTFCLCERRVRDDSGIEQRSFMLSTRKSSVRGSQRSPWHPQAKSRSLDLNPESLFFSFWVLFCFVLGFLFLFFGFFFLFCSVFCLFVCLFVVVVVGFLFF